MKLIVVNGKLNKQRVISLFILGISFLFLIGHITSLIVMNNLFLLMTLLIFIISLGSISFFKGQNNIGYIHFSLNYLEINVEEKNEKYLISELKYLKFKIHSYNGQKGFITLFTLNGASGLGNFLYFGEPDRKHQFYLEDERQKETLIVLIEDLMRSKYKPIIEYKVDKIY